MFRTAHTFGGILILAAAVVLVTPSFGQAQRGGGGRGGGGAHFSGGGHVGPTHVGATHVGGYNGGIYHSGIRNYGGYRSSGSYVRSGYGYRRPYVGYNAGYYPYYGLYGSYPSSGYDSDNYGSIYTGSGTTDTPSYADVTSYYLGGANPPSSGAPANLTVKVPADALVWFDGVQMTSTGPVRTYESPPLAQGQYSYEVRARWNENGHEVTQTQQVGVTPGAHVEVDFPAPQGTANKAQPTQMD
jgi:uncharacterized protein (TIGR03000 family)